MSHKKNYLFYWTNRSFYKEPGLSFFFKKTYHYSWNKKLYYKLIIRMKIHTFTIKTSWIKGKIEKVNIIYTHPPLSLSHIYYSKASCLLFLLYLDFKIFPIHYKRHRKKTFLHKTQPPPRGVISYPNSQIQAFLN